MKKFDYCIGNPAYQETQDATSDKPVYNFFMDEAFKIADKVEMITPARFLFDAGKTPSAWNKKMLNDDHLKVVKYYQNPQEVFPGNLINGGIVITYRDADKICGKIGAFSNFEELNTIKQKVKSQFSKVGFDQIVEQQNKWDLDVLYSEHPEYHSVIGSNGRERRLTTSIFSSLSVFHEQPAEDDIAILGLKEGKRCIRYVSSKYIDHTHKNLNKWKVIVSSGDGAAGTIGIPIPARVSGVPSTLEPNIGYTQTFIGFGAFESQNEAIAAEKYLKTKFARTMLATLKVTQHNHKDTWANVPIQDFSDISDIDWSNTIAEIDQQLYKKYGLSKEEIKFIETYVKEMA